MTLREIEKEALGLTPAERALLAGLMLRSLGQALQQLSLATAEATPIEVDRSALEARIDAVFADATSGQPVEWTDEHWERLLRDEPGEFESSELALLALPTRHRS